MVAPWLSEERNKPLLEMTKEEIWGLIRELAEQYKKLSVNDDADCRSNGKYSTYKSMCSCK